MSKETGPTSSFGQPEPSARDRSSTRTATLISLLAVIIVFSALVTLGTIGLGLERAGSQDLEAQPQEEKPPPQAAEVALTGTQTACAFLAPRFNYLLGNFGAYEQQLISEDELAIEAIVGAERLLNAARQPGLTNDFVQWLTKASAAFEQFGNEIWANNSVPEDDLVYDFSFEEIGQFCPDYERENPEDGIEIAAEIPFAIFFLDGGVNWLSCAFTHLGPETAGQIGADVALLSFFIERSNKLLYFEQVEIPLDEDQLGAEFETDIGSVFVFPDPNLGPVEGFVFDESLLPTTGDIRVGCSKQYVGDFPFPRVVEVVSLDSFRLRQIGLR